MHLSAVCYYNVKLYRLVLFTIRGRNCLPTSTRMQKRETCRTRTVLMRWKMTASWWTEMYVPCLVSSSTSACLSLLSTRVSGMPCVLVSRRWNVNCVCISCSWWFMFKLSSGDWALSFLSSLCLPPVLLSLLFAPVSFSPCGYLFSLLFSLPVCPFFFSSTVACFFQSGRYCIKSSFSATSETSSSHVPYFLILPVNI